MSPSSQVARNLRPYIGTVTVEHVTDAIEQAETDLATTRTELQMARELVATLEHDAKRIEIELVGLRSYAQRRGLTPTTDSSIASIGGIDDGSVVPISPGIAMATAPAITDLMTMSRNEAVSTVMSQAPGPMDRSSIHEQCALGGRDDTLDDISLSLSGLKRAGRVEKLGRGLWRLVEQTPAFG